MSDPTVDSEESKPVSQSLARVAGYSLLFIFLGVSCLCLANGKVFYNEIFCLVFVSISFSFWYLCAKSSQVTHTKNIAIIVCAFHLLAMGMGASRLPILYQKQKRMEEAKRSLPERIERIREEELARIEDRTDL